MQHTYTCVMTNVGLVTKVCK